MNSTLIILINALVITIIYHGFGIEYRILTSDYFNREKKCYFLKDLEDTDYSHKELRYLKVFRYLKVQDGKLILFNERGFFIDKLLIVPLGMFFVVLPMIIFSPNLLISLGFLNGFLIYYYLVLFAYVRFKRNKTKLIDEKFPYKISYTMFAVNSNIVNVFVIAMYVFTCLVVNDTLVYIILLLSIIKLHIYIYIDKIDEHLKWNSLKSNNLERFKDIEYNMDMFLIAYWIIITFTASF